LASGEVENIKESDIISKGRIREEIKYLKNGQEVTGKLVTMSDNINYKRIYEMFTGLSSKGKVIHHMIEQQMTGFVDVMTEAFINNARRLKGVPQGIINDVVHLRKIRIMLNEMYSVLKLSTSQMTDQQIVNSFINFANYTDELFEASFRYADDMGEGLTKEGLEEFTEQWLQNNPYRNEIA
jgi:hypothetical protein